MRTRKWILAAATLSILGVSGDCRKCYVTIENSAAKFQQYFSALEQASMNPMERFVFSLALANTKTQPSKIATP